jgi:hypothetical protein
MSFILSCTGQSDVASLNSASICRYSWRALVVGLLLSVTASGVHAQPAEQHDAASPAGRPELVVHLFGSVDWEASQQPETPNSFALGQFALFATSAINDRVSVLAEVVMEASGANTRVITDLERLQLTYRLNDHLNISAGRYHTGIGYYNAAFHHGSYFEIPIGRPRIFAFEDEGGVLPVHEVGVSVRGTVPKTGSLLHYVAEVGNGRRWTDLDEGEGLDQNDAKSTNIGLSLRPERWTGVELGASFYRDEIPTSPAPIISNQIAAAYGVYRTPFTEIMAEWLQLSYRQSGGPRDDSRGGYVQASRAFGRVRPYYRYDRLGIDPNTPLIGSFGSSEAHLLGVRLDPAEWVGLKAQYERRRENHANPFSGVHVQLVFVF